MGDYEGADTADVPQQNLKLTLTMIFHEFRPIRQRHDLPAANKWIHIGSEADTPATRSLAIHD